MKILLLTRHYPSATDRISAIFVADQAECLTRMGDVTVYMLESGKNRDTTQQQGVTCWRMKPSYLAERLYALRHAPPRHLFSKLLRYSWICRARAEHALTHYIAQHGKPDIIHAHNLYPAGWAIAPMAKKLGIPLVITEHSSFLPAQLTPALHRKQAQEICSYAHYVAVSPALANIIRAHLPDMPVQVIPNVIRTSQFLPAPRAPNQAVRLFCLCLLTQGKGVQYLLEALRTIPDCELVIGGDGAHRRALEQQAKQHNLPVRFTGLLTRAQAVQHMQQCDIFVLPSLGETFGIVLVEAMSCGKPVIATRCGGPESTVNSEVGLLVPPADAPALADAIRHMLSHRQTYAASSIRRHAEHFGEDAFLARIQALYRGVMA